MKKEKFYAVKKGRNPGIYRTWAECSKQVNKFSGAKFKSFDTLQEAENYMGKKIIENLSNNKQNKNSTQNIYYYVPIIEKQKLPKIYLFKKTLKTDFPNAKTKKFKSKEDAIKFLSYDFKIEEIMFTEETLNDRTDYYIAELPCGKIPVIYSSIKLLKTDYNNAKIIKVPDLESAYLELNNYSKENIELIGAMKYGKTDKIKKCVICQKPIRTGSWYCPTCKKKTENLNEFLTENHNLKYPLKTNFIARMRFCEQTDKDIFEFIRENPKSIFKYFYMEKECKNEIRQNYLKDRKKILEVSMDNIPYYIRTFFMDNTDKELLDIYGTDDNPILKVKCLKCNKEYTASFKDILKKNLHPCDVSMSSGEYKVKSFLESRNIKYLIQRDTLPCKNPITGHILPYDFELPEQKLIIEVQGEQHTHFISFFHSSKEAFEYQQFKDNIKKRVCYQKRL